MKIYSLYQKTLKSLKLFGLLLAIAFSFYSYGACNAGDFDCEQKIDTEVKHKELTTAENQFKEKLEEHYGLFEESIEGDKFYVFNEKKDASQGFEKECNGYYNEFKTLIGYLFVPKPNVVQPFFSPSGHYIQQIKNLQDKCLSEVKEKYLNLLKEMNALPIHGLNNVFANAQIREGSPPELIDLRDFFTADHYSKLRDCVSLFFTSQFTAKTREQILEGLHQKTCSETRGKIADFVNGDIFKRLVNLPGLCNENAGCVANLRNSAGILTPPPPQSESLFASCAERKKKTKDCCSSLESCENPVAKQAVQNYKSSIKSFVSSGKENACSSNKSGLKKIEDKLLENTQKVCKHFAKKVCQPECKEELDEFKLEFLKCFLVPGFDDQHFKHHFKNACGRDIANIKAEYKKHTITKAIELNFDSNEKEIANCLAPLEEMNKEQLALKDRVKGSVQGLCDELLAEAQKEKTQDQTTDTTTPTYTSPTIRSPAGSSGPSPGGSYNPSSGFDIGNGGYEVGKDVISTDNSLKNLDNKDSAYAGNFERASDSSIDEEENSFEEDASDCLGVCKVSDNKEDQSYPAWKKYYEAMAKGLGLEALADKVNEKLKAEREERERKLAEGGEGANSGGFVQGLQDSASSAFSGFARRARKPLRKAYKSMFGAPKPPPPKLKDVLNIHGSEIDLMQRQKELLYMFCNTHDCGSTKEELEQYKKEAKK